MIEKPFETFEVNSIVKEGRGEHWKRADNLQKNILSSSIWKGLSNRWYPRALESVNSRHFLTSSRKVR